MNIFFAQLTRTTMFLFDRWKITVNWSIHFELIFLCLFLRQINFSSVDEIIRNFLLLSLPSIEEIFVFVLHRRDLLLPNCWPCESRRKKPSFDLLWFCFSFHRIPDRLRFDWNSVSYLDCYHPCHHLDVLSLNIPYVKEEFYSFWIQTFFASWRTELNSSKLIFPEISPIDAFSINQKVKMSLINKSNNNF